MNNNEYTINKLKVLNNAKINNIITKAEYEYYERGKKVKYESDFVSIIDVPYRRYKLI